MTKLKTHPLYAAVFISLFTLVNSACAQETTAAASQARAAAVQDKIPLTSELSELLPGSYVLEHSHGRVHWGVNHHGFSTFRAVFPMNQAELTIDANNIENSTLLATVDMTKVDTSIDVFDKRLQGAKFFNTEKYPTSTFRSTKIVDNGDNTMTVSGDLTFLGITKPAVMNVAFKQAGHANSPPAGYRIGFDATMIVNRSEFGMRKTTISEEVELLIEAEFVIPQGAAK